MSQEQIERIQASYAAFNRGDFDSVLESWDDDTEFVAPEDMPEQSSFRRPEGYRQFFAAMLDVFEEFRSAPERIIEVGDEKYLVFATERFRRKVDAILRSPHGGVRDGVEAPQRAPLLATAERVLVEAHADRLRCP